MSRFDEAMDGLGTCEDDVCTGGPFCPLPGHTRYMQMPEGFQKIHIKEDAMSKKQYIIHACPACGDVHYPETPKSIQDIATDLGVVLKEDKGPAHNESIEGRND